MEETEKMLALKKAYAEIILNTAKEAAARVMVSERKAQQFHHDLGSTKEEAVRLLLRLKQSMDVKISEVEMKSMNQQRRIDELEAQLQEAEDIVSNLRAELNQAHKRLDEWAYKHMYSEPKLMEKAVCEGGNTQPENRPSEAVLASQVKWISNDGNRHSVVNNFLQDYGCSGGPDVPSIIIKRKQPELYRNGCTQRIRACEGSRLNGHFSLAGGLEHLEIVKATGENNKAEGICTTTPIGADTTCDRLEKTVDSEEVKCVDKSSCKSQTLKSSHKKRKRATIYRRSDGSIIKYIPRVPKEAHFDLSNSQARLLAGDVHESLDQEGKSKESGSSLIAPSNISNMGALSDQVASVQGDDKITETCVEDMNGDKEVASRLGLVAQQSTSGYSLDVPSSKPEFERKNSSSMNLDATALEACDGLSSPRSKDRVLKYTFQRKRKKESLVIDDSRLLHHEDPSRREMMIKKNCSLEPPKSGAMTESSRDSQRMAQVALEFISLSERQQLK